MRDPTLHEGLQALRDALSALKPGDPIVLQIDRYGQLVYISFSL